jgi:hypothetical protein
MSCHRSARNPTLIQSFNLKTPQLFPYVSEESEAGLELGHKTYDGTDCFAEEDCRIDTTFGDHDDMDRLSARLSSVTLFKDVTITFPDLSRRFVATRFVCFNCGKSGHTSHSRSAKSAERNIAHGSFGHCNYRYCGIPVGGRLETYRGEQSKDCRMRLENFVLFLWLMCSFGCSAKCELLLMTRWISNQAMGGTI